MIINYGGALINVEKIIYGIIKRYDDGGSRFKFSIYLEDGKTVEWGNYKTREEAQVKYDDFFQTLLQHQYVIQELP